MGGTEGERGHVLVNSAMTGAVHRRQGHGLWVGGIAMGHGYWSMTGAVGIGTWGGTYLLTITGTGAVYIAVSLIYIHVCFSVTWIH